MKGDRVQISSSNINVDPKNVIQVYMPKTNPNGSLVLNPDGSCLLDKVGGVREGSTGVIKDEPVKVHFTQIDHLNTGGASFGTNEFVAVFPVFLDAYQQIGWFPSDRIKVVSGAILK